MLTIQNINLITGISELFFTSGPEDYTAVINYSTTADFLYRQPGLTGMITKTITWNLKSSKPIVGGTFLDNTPWIVDNGDINLISVSPQSTQYEALYFTDASVTGLTATYMFDANNTVINPDHGKDRSSGITGFIDITLTDSNNISIENITISGNVMHPYDGRAGFDGVDLGKTSSGRYYDDSQKWNNIQTKLKKGDMVVTAISHYDDYKLIIGNLKVTNGCYIVGLNCGRKSFIDVYGALTIIGSTYSAIASNSFRPPVNWDPKDRENAPIMQELDNFENYLIDYPEYDFDKNTRSWNPNTEKMSDYFNSASGFANLGGRTCGQFGIHLGAVLPNFHSENYTQQGSRFARDIDNDEYGGNLYASDEIRFITMLERSVDSGLRNRIRRALVQRAIDTYGAMRSLGRQVGYAGGHGVFQNPHLPLAYLATKNPDMYNLMQLESIGNTANNTYQFSDYGRYGFIKFRPMALNGIVGLLKKEKASQNFWHPAKWNKLEIAGISTGTDSKFGAFQKVFVKPPKSTIMGITQIGGAIITDIQTGITSLYGWKREDLYNFSKSQTSRPGPWNMNNNANLLVSSQFIGGYIQNPSRGSTYISRIIESKPSSAFPTEKSTGELNDLIAFYTRSNIFLGGETYCNISPYVLEDFQNDVFMLNTSGDSVSYPYGFLTYSWQAFTNMLSFTIIYDALLKANLPVPKYILEHVELARNTHGTRLGRLLYFYAYSSVYNFPTAYPAYQALIRKYILNGNTGSTASHVLGVTFTDSFSNMLKTKSPKRSYYPEDRTDWTWLENESPPNNITVATRKTLTTSTSNAQKNYYYFTEGATTPVGILDSRLILHPQNTNNVAVRIISTTGTAVNGITQGIDYNSFINNKHFYVWVNGSQKPIKLIKYSEVPPTTNQLVWSQIWLFSNSPTFDYFKETFPVYDEDGETSTTCFFAD